MKDMNKVIIFTYFNRFKANYGALLVAYALQKTLSDNQINAPIIDYSRYYNDKYKEEDIWINSKDEENFNSFCSKYLVLTKKKYSSKEELEELNQFYDTFILGSDMVWYMDYARSDNMVTFFNFVHRSKNLISYAASFGSTKFEATYLEKLRAGLFISRFNSLSVREKSGLDIIHNDFKLNKNVTHVLDPVLLISKQDWSNLCDTSINYKVPFYYILSGKYLFSCNKFKANTYMSGASIHEWLASIKTSEFVITNSFHAIVFSLIFNKPFCAIFDSDNDSIERIISLFDTFHIDKSKILIVDNISEDPNYYKQYLIDDFSYFNAHINAKRKRSIKFLLESIKKPKDKEISLKYKNFLLDYFKKHLDKFNK